MMKPPRGHWEATRHSTRVPRSGRGSTLQGKKSMARRRLIFLAVAVMAAGVAGFTATPVRAAEPYLEFVRGLRDRDYHDYAMLYLEQLEKRTDVPADVKE